MSSVPQIQFEAAGLVLPTEAAILTGVQTDQDAAFGGGLNPALNTPQGQLASSTTAIVADKDNQIAYLVNQFDPQYASGRFQDALARIYFLTRKPAAATTVTCTVGGLPGAVIPAGTLAQDTSGNIYVLLANVTIGSGGTVSSTWQNQATGPIPCPANTLTQVYQAINGWDTITNPAAGSLGNVVESRADFYNRIQNSVAINGRGTTGAIYAAVFQVDNVLDCFVIDNPTGSTVNYGSTNYPLAAHSVFVAVVGGNSQSVAEAIWSKKDVGCSYNTTPGQGTIATETVIDTSGYNYPQPSYQVSFMQPGALPIYFDVQIANSAALPSNIVTLVQNAIIAQFNGQNGNARARIGSTILAAQYYAAVAAIGPYVTLLQIQVGTTSPGASDLVEVGIDQTPTLQASNITVTLV